MSCSLKEVKDGLVNLKIVSSYMEIKSMDKVLRFENSYIDAYTKKHGSLVELGSMFVFEDLRGKTKLAFNKPFFEKMDQLENAVFFKKNALREGFSEEEVVSDLEIKEGVDSIFEANPQLEEIGSQEEYSAYLDTVFPESQVKDIVYHGSKSAEKFSIPDFSKNEWGEGFYVTSDYRYAKGYTNGSNNVMSLMINSKNIKEIQGAYMAGTENIEKYFDEIKNLESINLKNNSSVYYVGEDGLSIRTLKDEAEKVDFQEKNSGWEDVSETEINDKIKELQTEITRIEENGVYDTVLTNDESGAKIIYAVFKPEQIHILGSEQDINGFNDYIESISSEESTASKEIKESAINKIDYSEETKDILSQTENMKELFLNNSSVMLVGTDESQLVNLIKTEDGRHFLFVDLQDLKEVTEERFNELVDYSKAEIATSEEKNSFVEQYSSIAYMEQVESNPMISKEQKQASINDIALTDSKIEEMKKIYAQIDSMLESNEITVTCKI